MKRWILMVLMLIPLVLYPQENPNKAEAFIGLHYNALDSPSQGGNALASVVLNTRVEFALSYEYLLIPVLEIGGEASIALFPYFEDEDGDDENDILLADYELRGKFSILLGGLEAEGLLGWFFYYPEALGQGAFTAWDMAVRLRYANTYVETAYIIPVEETFIHPFDSTMYVEPFVRIGVGYTL